MTVREAADVLQVSRADFTGSSFTDVNLSGVVFDNVAMPAGRMTDVNLADTVISNANLSGVTITNAKLDGMTIDGVLVTELLELHRQTLQE